MNQTLPTCARCATSFWPNGRLNPDPRKHFCDGCDSDDDEVALSSDTSFQEKKAAQSTRNQSLIEIVRGNTKPLPASSRLPIQPREMPTPRSQQVGRPTRPIPKPALPQTLAFNCPACMAVLNISRDLAIAGTTAPCPHCASMVIPPRIAPAAAVRPAKRSSWRPER